MPGRIAGQIAPKGIIAGSTRSLRGNADDAEVVPPGHEGCADDAEVVPPQESAGLRKRRRHGEETVMRFAEMALVSLMSSVQSTTRTSERLR